MLRFNREKLILGLVFFISLAVQLWLWLGRFPYTDNNIWVPGAQDFANGILPGYFTTIPPHPGTTILLPAAALILFGVSAYNAMQIAISVLMTCGIVCMVYLCRVLRPKSPWWLGVCALFIPNPLYLEMSVPSALAAVLSCIYILLVLYIREKGSSRELFAFLGVCAGVLLATRTDVGVSIMLFSLPFLWPLAGKKLIETAVFALLYFGALNPFIWENPIKYAWEFVGQVGANTMTPFGFEYPLSITIFAGISFVLGFTSAYSRVNFSSLPKDYLKWILATTVLVCGLLLLSKYHPSRYFFPYIAIGEMFLPLFLLDLLDRFGSWRIFQPAYRSAYALMALFLVSRIWTIYSLWLHVVGPLFHFDV